MTAYDFHEQLAIGHEAEALLDAYFKSTYDIAPASPAEQKKDIDRWFANRKTGHRFSVEYKADSIAGHTGNAFVEIESSHEQRTPGWANFSEAEYLIYLVTDPETIYVLRFDDLRRRLPFWKLTYRSQPVENAHPSYTTVGLLVPLEEFERCAIWKR